MSVKVKSSQAQQNFGLLVDQVLVEGDIIIERYGVPRVAIVEYGRYQRLLEAEQKLLHTWPQQATAVDQIMKFAGCWGDMNEESFQDFLDEITQRRKSSVSRRRRDEAGLS